MKLFQLENIISEQEEMHTIFAKSWKDVEMVARENIPNFTMRNFNIKAYKIPKDNMYVHKDNIDLEG